MKSARLLLADDDGVSLATFGKGLEEEGYQVRVAHSGEEALQLASEEAPDLAILDMRMPGLSGVETARELGKLDVSVIFISAYDDEEYVQGAVREGALGYLLKPLGVSEAIPTIESALERAGELDGLKATESRLNNALDTGNIVNVVVGMLMERHRIEKSDAFDMLRRQARSEQRKVRDVAEEIMAAWATINRFAFEKPDQ